MKPNIKFAAFILTHGRPDNVVTYRSLRRSGYTGRIYIVLDNEDKYIDKYIDRFGADNIIVFDKLKVSKEFDTADNFNDRRAIVYARNYCFDLADKLGLDSFIELDDDYVKYDHRFNSRSTYQTQRIRDMDNIIGSIIEFMEKCKNVKSVSIAQGGDFIGGGEGKKLTLKRKCMNSFVCFTDRPFKFLGAINEDVNTYTRCASTGHLFFTYTGYSLTQKQTQSNEGGMTDIYLDGGTYKKSFYTVLFQPSSVKVAMMGDKHQRLHHRVSWNNTVPKIIREEYKAGGINGKE